MQGRFNGRVVGQDYTGRNARHNGRAGVYNAVQSAFGPSLDITLANGLSSLFTYTRATTATVQDFEGLIKSCLSGELRIQGARRVRNLRTSSQSSTGLTADKSGAGVNAAFTNNYAEAPDGTMTAMRLVLDCGGTGAGDSSQCYQSLGATGVNSVWVKSNTGSSFVINGEYTNQSPLTITTTWRRLSWAGVTSYFGFSNYGNLSGGVQVADLLVWGMQKEDTTGQANQNPSEYVSTGVLSSRFHGYFVDGVKYFSYENGNTVSSNLVTEAQGAAITGTIGYLQEGARTTYGWWNRDLTNAAWTATNVTVAKTATGADGVANSASTLTATAGNGTVLQSITRASAQRVTGCYIKRRTGSGTINMTQDNGGTWTAVTVTAGWTFVAVPAATAANPIIGFRIVTSGDAIDVDYVMHEEAASNSSVIETTTAAVARNADVLTFPAAGIVDGTVGTVYMEYMANALIDYEYMFGGSDGASYMLLCDASGRNQSFDKTNNPITAGVYSVGSLKKVALAWSGSTMQFAYSGTTPAATAFDGDFNLSANIAVGSGNGSTVQMCFGVIPRLRVYRSRLSAAQLAAMTS